MKKPGPVFRILQLLATKKKEALVLLMLVIFATGFDISVPFISQRLIDDLVDFFRVGGRSPVMILMLSAAGILLATVVSRLLQSIYDFNLFKTVTKLEDNLRHKVFEKYLRLHVLFHHHASSGQIIGRLDRGAVATYVILHDIFGHNLVPPLAVFLGVIILLLFKNPLIALTVFLPLPVYIFAIKNLTEKIYRIEQKANDEFEETSKLSYDVAGNVLTVKKFNQEHAETENQTRLQTKARTTQYGAERLWTILENIQTVVATAGRIGVIILAGFLVLKSKSTIGEFVLYVTLQNMAYNPLSQLSIIFPRLRRNVSRAERLFRILDEPIRVLDKPGAQPLKPLTKEIEFEKVWFKYGEVSKWAIKNVNIVIPAKATVALGGRSGSGKSTLINLLLRSYDPTKGKILIDGSDLRDITRASLLTQIAVVPQEVDLFSRTIFDNIAYGKPDVAREDVIKAAKTALAHDFILATEKGYDTLVGERGIKLSGGERQRIGIARAVLRDPRILILDEATSHLDTESEQLIAEATDALIKDRTTIIIAHRLSTVLRAHMILVFKDGAIEAAGKHQELLKKNATYRKLYSLQFGNDSRN